MSNVLCDSLCLLSNHQIIDRYIDARVCVCVFAVLAIDYPSRTPLPAAEIPNASLFP